MTDRRTPEQIAADFDVISELLQLVEAVRLFELGAGGFHSMLRHAHAHGTEASTAAWAASRLARRHGFNSRQLRQLLRQGIEMLETGEATCAQHLGDDDD